MLQVAAFVPLLFLELFCGAWSVELQHLSILSQLLLTSSSQQLKSNFAIVSLVPYLEENSKTVQNPYALQLQPQKAIQWFAIYDNKARGENFLLGYK
ncbi:hypothetical protein ACOSQ2_028409 [Xanthoceras sorbifolium]